MNSGFRHTQAPGESVDKASETFDRLNPGEDRLQCRKIFPTPQFVHLATKLESDLRRRQNSSAFLQVVASSRSKLLATPAARELRSMNSFHKLRTWMAGKSFPLITDGSRTNDDRVRRHHRDWAWKKKPLEFMRLVRRLRRSDCGGRPQLSAIPMRDAEVHAKERKPDGGFFIASVSNSRSFESRSLTK